MTFLLSLTHLKERIQCPDFSWYPLSENATCALPRKERVICQGRGDIGTAEPTRERQVYRQFDRAFEINEDQN